MLTADIAIELTAVEYEALKRGKVFQMVVDKSITIHKTNIPIRFTISVSKSMKKVKRRSGG